MWTPTLHKEGEGRSRWVQGNGWNRPSHERSRPSGPPGYLRWHVGKRRSNATREDHAVKARDFQPDAREGQPGPLGVTERPVVCAGQCFDPEGSSPSAARMRGGVSKGGGNASPAGERGHGEP